MNAKAIGLWVGAIVACLALNGCVLALGNRVPPPNASTPTLGKQLTDLKKAHESGAITDEEYQTARKRLVEGSH
jgi:hypothetical protein